MAPSSTLQSRINQFESLNSVQSSKPAVTEHVNAYAVRKPVIYPPIGSTNPLDDPISPTLSKLRPEIPIPYVPRKQRSLSPSPPNLGLKTSLIDLSDWTAGDEGPDTSSLSVKPSDIARANPKQVSVEDLHQVPIINLYMNGLYRRVLPLHYLLELTESHLLGEYPLLHRLSQPLNPPSPLLPLNVFQETP